MGRRRDMLTGFIAAHLGIHCLLSPPTQVTLYRITGEQDVGPTSEVTTAHSFCVFVGTEATHLQARVVTRKALSVITRRPDESVAAAAARLIAAYATVYRDRPQASEIMFLWPNTLNDDIENLMW